MGKLILLKEIESCRREMISLSYYHELTSDIMIESSMKLDELINKYQKYTEYEYTAK
ncbi:aspartyl-phosphate phosphatase Spo0E family protein [Oceanobacillus sp. CAU 1775]